MITLGTLLDQIKKANLICDFSLESSGIYSIKIYRYSPTAQAGYEHQLMYNDRSRNLDRLLEYALEWVLTHRRKVRESNRP